MSRDLGTTTAGELMTGLWLISYIALWLLFLALWILFLIVAIVLLSVLHNLGVLYETVSGSSTWSPPATKLVAGQSLPELTLYTLSGNTVPLANFHGIKTAFSIISPHCPSCRSLLEALATGDTPPDRRNPSVHRRVVVSLGDATETAHLVQHMRLQEDLPILVDTDKEVAKKWGVALIPVTVIVDDHLTVVKQIIGGKSTAT